MRRNTDPTTEVLIQNNAAGEIVNRVFASRSTILSAARRECRFYASHAAPDREAVLYVSKRVCRMLDLSYSTVVVTACHAFDGS